MGTTEFYKAYDAVVDKHNIGVREMLVLLKAYVQYKADEGSGKLEDRCGWMKEAYDILPCFNRFGEGCIFIPDSFGEASVFWESDVSRSYWRLAKEGLVFVEENQNLYEAFMSVAKVVIEA